MRTSLHICGVEPIFLVFCSQPHSMIFREFHRFEWAKHGLDHRVGHSLLLLYDAKAPHSQKRK
jgi:hypothetical protein